MATEFGPLFAPVPSVEFSALRESVRELAPPRDTPVVVRGAGASWPALSKWSFASIADLSDSQKTTAHAQNGLIEQGRTSAPVKQTVAEYLRKLASQEATPPHLASEEGLAPPGSVEAASLAAGKATRLRFSWLSSFKADKLYLAHWDMLAEFPHLRKDVDIKGQWPALTTTFPIVWLGPGRTVTGLHYDLPNNWFTQIRGYKEFLVIPPSQGKHIPLNDKYDNGGILCALDITNLPTASPEALKAFASIEGALYVRLGPGDALFVPKGWFHSVIAVSPSISVSTFGHNPFELATTGLGLELRNQLHQVGLWRWGPCSCHGADTPRPKAAWFILSALFVGAAAVLFEFSRRL